MCGQFFIAREGGDALLTLLLDEASRRRQAVTGETEGVARGRVRPSETVAALAVGRSGRVGAFPMQWGFHRPGGTELIINARSETACQSPLFGPSMRERRCLIPLSWYFEWERNAETENGFLPPLPKEETEVGRRPAGKKGNAVRYAIRPAVPGPVYLAAIYRWEEGRRLPSLAVLTRAPSPEVAFIHDRMPVIFSDRNRALWLDRSVDPEKALRVSESSMAFRPAWQDTEQETFSE